MKKLALLAAIAAAMLAYPAVSSAASFRGVVFAKQAKRHALAVASAHGKVRVVRTNKMRIRVGTRVAVRARPLRDGTFRATHITVAGHAEKIELEGRIVSVTPATAMTAGAIVLQTEHGAQVTIVVPAGTALPDLKAGDEVEVEVALGDGNTLTLVKLEQEDEDEDDDDDDAGEVQKTEVEGQLVSVTEPTAATAGAIVIKTENGKEVTITVPAGTTLPALHAGDRVEAKVKVDNGTLTLLRIEVNGDDDDDDGGGGDDGGGDH
jgi:ribosomal protein L19